MRHVLFIFALLLPIAASAQLGPEATQLGADPVYYAAKAANGLDVEAANAKTKQLLHSMQLAIERYGVDNPKNLYPESIDVLVHQGYLLPGLYINPVTSVDGLWRNARDVPFGWSAIAPGNFTYLKKYNPAGEVIGYVLLGYGADPENLGAGGVKDVNLDGQPDGVIIMLWTQMTREDGSVIFENGPNSLRGHGEEIVIDFKRLFPDGLAYELGF
jgi:hypothetical protein